MHLEVHRAAIVRGVSHGRYRRRASGWLPSFVLVNVAGIASAWLQAKVWPEQTLAAVGWSMAIVIGFLVSPTVIAKLCLSPETKARIDHGKGIESVGHLATGLSFLFWLFAQVFVMAIADGPAVLDELKILGSSVINSFSSESGGAR